MLAYNYRIPSLYAGHNSLATPSAHGVRWVRARRGRSTGRLGGTSPRSDRTTRRRRTQNRVHTCTAQPRGGTMPNKEASRKRGAARRQQSASTKPNRTTTRHQLSTMGGWADKIELAGAARTPHDLHWRSEPTLEQAKLKHAGQ